MTISPTMNLCELASRMGQITTEDEARAMRELLVQHWNGLELAELEDSTFFRFVANVVTREYQIAFQAADGNWDIVKNFEACRDEAANRYAETAYPGTDWYVLRDGQNINGGE
jgi:hypothetical protein